MRRASQLIIYVFIGIMFQTDFVLGDVVPRDWGACFSGASEPEVIIDGCTAYLERGGSTNSISADQFFDGGVDFGPIPVLIIRAKAYALAGEYNSAELDFLAALKIDYASRQANYEFAIFLIANENPNRNPRRAVEKAELAVHQPLQIGSLRGTGARAILAAAQAANGEFEIAIEIIRAVIAHYQNERGAVPSVFQNWLTAFKQGQSVDCSSLNQRDRYFVC